MSTPSFTIGQRRIGPGYSCHAIAELSANHCNNYEIATVSVMR